mmetsp:Transcript_1333/g.4496  ORF Transcript_1333/g.4496 Transcript_1333/m.4496 type:complete len:229 (-) Transcript_1333:1052-1738(-)
MISGIGVTGQLFQRMLRTFLTAQILVKRISLIFAWHLAVSVSYSWVSSSLCSSFSFISSVSALMLAMASASCPMNFVLASLISVAPQALSGKPFSWIIMYCLLPSSCSNAVLERASGQNLTTNFWTKSSVLCSSSARPSTCRKFVLAGLLAQPRTTSFASLSNAPTTAMKIWMFLSFSSRTFSWVWYFMEYLPSEITSTALCASSRPPSDSMVSANARATHFLHWPSG